LANVAIYRTNDNSVVLDLPLPAEYLSDPNPLYMRVWQGLQNVSPTSSQPIVLTDSTDQPNPGIQVAITLTPAAKGSALPVGAFWMIAVRPRTPQQVYPRRFLDSPQPPDGPRQWVCPLAVIDWVAGASFSFSAYSAPTAVIHDCRNPFDDLVELTRRKLGGCCTVSVRPGDISGSNSLQKIVDDVVRAGANPTVCLMPGTYYLPAPLRLDSRHSRLTIEGCHDGAVLQAHPGSEAQFGDGLIVMERANGVTLRGLRFHLPQVPAAQVAARVTGLASIAAVRPAAWNTENLHVSIALRPVHCARLAVENCLFRFSLTQQAPVFAVGIFAAGPSWGLQLEGNRFIREEDYLRSASGTFRLLVGYLLAPAVEPRGKTVGAQQEMATLLTPLLDDAVLRANRFAGLTIAALVLSDCGVVRFEDNTVVDCLAGYISTSLLGPSLLFNLIRTHTLATTRAFTVLPQVSAAANLNLITIELALLLILLYPLPANATPPGMALLAAGNVTTVKRVPGKKQRLVTLSPKYRQQAATWLATRVRQFFPPPAPAAAAAPAGQQAKPTTGSRRSPRRRSTPDTGAPAAAAAAPTKAVLPTAHLTLLEEILLLPARHQYGLKLSLHIGGNDIAVSLPKGPPNLALFVLDLERRGGGRVTVCSNTLRSRTVSLPTATVCSNGTCAVTGNVILNLEPAQRQDSSAYSLCVIMDSPASSGSAAVTGNTLEGQPELPARPFAQPMDKWDILNALVLSGTGHHE
jgi:hypothetical protein